MFYCDKACSRVHSNTHYAIHCTLSLTLLLTDFPHTFCEIATFERAVFSLRPKFVILLSWSLNPQKSPIDRQPPIHKRNQGYKLEEGEVSPKLKHTLSFWENTNLRSTKRGCFNQEFSHLSVSWGSWVLLDSGSLWVREDRHLASIIIWGKTPSPMCNGNYLQICRLSCV